MSKKITEHATGAGEILFMAAAKALHNKKTGKSEFSVKVRLKEDDAAVEHLRKIADYKIDTKTNRANAGSGFVIVNFTSDFAPRVVDKDNNLLEGSDIPYFDGRKDKGTAAVTYKVIDYGNNSIVRLSGLKLIDLNLEPREGSDEQSLDVTMDMLKNIGA